MRKKASAFLRLLLFCSIAGVTGIGFSVFGSQFFTDGSSKVLDLESLTGVQQQLRVSSALIDRDSDGINDSAQVEIWGLPDFRLSYYLFCKSKERGIKSMVVFTGDEHTGEAIFKTDTDADGQIDQTYFRLGNLQQTQESTGISYYYRDLDLDGRIDMLTLFQDDKPGWGYIMNGLTWQEYEREIGNWKTVQLKDDHGVMRTATFSDGKWTVVDNDDSPVLVP